MMNRKFVLIDGHAFIWRAILSPHARNGPNAGVYIFFRTLIGIIKQMRPSHVLMAMDCSRERLHRRKILPTYKSKRPEFEPRQIAQAQKIKDLLTKIEFPQYVCDGWEADDIIATACAIAGSDIDTVICSRDKDLMQLLRPGVVMFDAMTNEWINEDSACAKWGVKKPSQILEIQILSGDMTDDIPGVKGCGKKRATQLIQKYGTAKNAIAHKHECTPALRRGLDEFDYDLGRRLVELKCDLDIPYSADQLLWTGMHLDRAALDFHRVGIRT